jgi:hypothetical protein
VAHRTPDTVETHGDAKRLANAVASFIVELSVDRRVLTHYDAWRADRAPLDRAFEQLLAEHPETIDTFIADVYARDYAATRPFVRTLLQRLPATWTHMVTRELLRAFRTAHYTGRTRADVPPPDSTTPMFGVAVQLQPTHPRGKVPHDPYPVTHNLRLLYRNAVQEPRDSLRTLAREHAGWGQQDPDDCLRDVRRCLTQARALLDLAARSDWAQPGRIVVPQK